MQTGPDGIYLMHYYERCKLTAYPDPATGGEPWTIGWGDTGPDVVPGLTITQEEADQRFARRLSMEFEPGVEAAVTSGATQKQFDALVCFAYNCGLRNLRNSTLLKLHNKGQHRPAADAFQSWVLAAGRVMKGLQRRRHAERAVYLGGDGQSAVESALEAFP